MTIKKKQSVKQLSTIDLIDTICHQEDLTALSEFLERPLCEIEENKRLNVPAYIHKLYEDNAEHGNWNTADFAQKLTLAKLCNLQDVAKGGFFGSRTDCLNYYRALRSEVKKIDKKNLNPLQLENEAAKVVQNFVKHHFYLSCKEAKRKNPFVSRHRHRSNGGGYDFWFRFDVHKQERDKIIQKYIQPADFRIPGEQQRIQALIDQYFPPVSIAPIESCPEIASQDYPTWSEQYAAGVDSMVDYLADEKAAKYKEQRPSIQVLGPKKISRLIRRILRDIERDTYSITQVAHDFGLDKATVSRFAAKNFKIDSVDGDIPDLWANFCQVLAQEPDFKAAVTNAKLLEHIERVDKDLVGKKRRKKNG